MSEEDNLRSSKFIKIFRGLAMDEVFYQSSEDPSFLMKRDMGVINALKIYNSQETVGLPEEFQPDFKALYTFVIVFLKVTESDKEYYANFQKNYREGGLLVDLVLVDLESLTFSCADGGKMSDKGLAKAVTKTLEILHKGEEYVRTPKQKQLPAARKGFGPEIVIIILNIVIFVLSYISDSIVDLGILDGGLVRQGEVWRLITAIFLHGDFAHLFGNMYLLFMLGRALSNYDKKKFIFVYFTSGVVGTILSALFLNARSLGASGAIMGLGGVLLCKLIFDENKKYYRHVSLFIHLAILILFNLGYGLFNPGIDNFGHFGGFICGFILELLFQIINSKKKA